MMSCAVSRAHEDLRLDHQFGCFQVDNAHAWRGELRLVIQGWHVLNQLQGFGLLLGISQLLQLQLQELFLWQLLVDEGELLLVSFLMKNLKNLAVLSLMLILQFGY